MTDDTFYLGKIFDSKAAKLTDAKLQYDPADLTTHAVVTGMTGSGKTGLCISLLEEAALQGVPAIIIDPKGDLTNLLLHFPNLLPADFQPWLDPEMVRRSGKSEDEVALEAATSWRNGLKDWGIGPDRIQDLQNLVKFAVYTPGSDAGIPVSVLSSLAAPKLDWEENREALRERISSTVTALLGLVGMNDLDPIRSREHILLSNIFEEHWSNGRDLDLTELILQTQTPPFDKLGAFPVDTFFPPKDRMELAMTINNILAATAFQSWREGESLDVAALLFTPEGQPRHSIFYLAHLSDGERMFFTTLLLSAVETWMRTQGGTSNLRALLYMDEIYGYLPPTANPPSKQPLLRMLKQARAFGLGLLLATQNPVDMDYKALSNTGTWFIGKLQTERDKNRLLDGLESLAGGFSRAEMDKLISALGKRVFVMNNVHEKNPILFQTRWAMNFLAGPLTRSQIRPLNQLVGAGEQPVASETATSEAVASRSVASRSVASEAVNNVQTFQRSNAPTATAPQPLIPNRPVPNRLIPNSANGSATKPSLPAGIREYFLPQNNSLSEAFQSAGKPMTAQAQIQGILYRPALLASAQIRLLDRKYGVDSEMVKSALVETLDRRGIVRWEDFPFGGSLDKVETMPTPSARFAGMESPLNDSKMMTALQKDFADWLLRNTEVTARANLALKIFAGPDITQAEFMKECAEAAREARDAEFEKKTAAIDRKIKSVEDKLMREERELRQDQEDLRNRNIEAGLNGVEAVAGLFGLGRKKSLSTPMSKLRMAQNAKEDVRESEDAIAQYQKDIADLQRERQSVEQEINDKWGRVVNEISEVAIKPKKTDIYINYFGVAWNPYYLVDVNGETMELPAFGAE